MPRPAASLANLIPFTSESAREFNKLANKVRWGFRSKVDQTGKQVSPDPSLLKRVNAMLARTTDTKRLSRLVQIRGELMKQEGKTVQVDQPAKPKPKITLRLP